jgi:dTDP-4-dehydrorhamnose reductase
MMSDPKRVLVLGGTGMLGHKLVQVLSSEYETWATLRRPFAGFEELGLFDRSRTIDNLEVTRPDALEHAIDAVRPDVVINCVGIIKQLPEATDVIETLTVNSILPHRLARLSESGGFRLITISTDCVFKGTKGGYVESDETDATDVYGRSKALGEITGGNTLTLRTSIVGPEMNTHHSLLEWFLTNTGETVNGYVNAIYSGFPTVVFADIIKDLIRDHQSLSGLYHVSSDAISKYDLLKLINEAYQADVTIEPVGEPHIDRSLDSRLFRTATGFTPKEWPEMVQLMAADHRRRSHPTK